MNSTTKVAVTIGVLAVIATAGVAGTFAGFNANDRTAQNSFDTGNVAIALEAPSGLDGRDWAPGDSATGTLKVTNTGRNKIRELTIEGDPGTDGINPALGDALRIEIREGDTVQVSDRTLNAFNEAQPFKLLGSETAAGNPGREAGSHTYTITLSLPATFGNELKDLAGAQTFTVRAVQRDGTRRSVSDAVDF